jgi:hypothetical protein
MGDAAYLQWLRGEPCAVQPCNGRAEAHHHTEAPSEQHDKSVRGRRGKGQKADDAFAFALCPKHHGQFHGARGFFEGWDHAQRRAWQHRQVDVYRFKYEAERSAPEVAREKKKRRPTLKQEAEAFGSTYELGPQVVHDLERLLRKVAKEAVF